VRIKMMLGRFGGSALAAPELAPPPVSATSPLPADDPHPASRHTASSTSAAHIFTESGSFLARSTAAIIFTDRQVVLSG
jgi:hypothetical protein